MSLTRSLSALAVAIAATATLYAQNTTIRLATVVPANSSWHKALLDMGAAWTKDTGGRVTLRVYDGGSQGDERTVIRLMRPGVDQLQASLLMVSGLGEIDEAFNVFGMPFFFQTDEEAIYVRNKLMPSFEKRVEAKGFKLLAWGSGGWVQLFSKMPVRTLDEVKKAKLYTSQGDEKMVQWYKANGFNPVALSSNDIPGAAQARHRHDQRDADAAVSRARAADLPGREVHARRQAGAAHRRNRHHEQRVEQDLR